MNLGSLVSETRNPQTMDLDALSTLELVNRFNQQDTLVAQAVKETLPEFIRSPGENVIICANTDFTRLNEFYIPL